MALTPIDWMIIAGFFLLTMIIGIWSSRTAGKSVDNFFLSGRNMPWWLLGISMVATTFSADTPNLVTEIVRQNGVSGNWVWWAFLVTGMFTVFIYAKLWRRSGITTDLEFYELRYSGKPAAFLRAFRAGYLGILVNILIMAAVLLAGIKIAYVFLGIGKYMTVLAVGVITVLYSSLGGLRGIILTDFFQFVLSMIGMILAAIFVVHMPEIGSLNALFSHPEVANKFDFIPDLSDPNIAIPFFFIPLAVQWWAVWYPGAEPGGGGYIAQRMLAARNENEAVKATLLFNLAHYALRPWPWIIIALASMVLYPTLGDVQTSFPGLDPDILGDDIAFSAMLTHLPSGLLGLIAASLIAALMSTISTHLNWGSSYVVNDLYNRFLPAPARPIGAVALGRWSTVLLMIGASIFALYLDSALEAFNILLQIGAGTGLLFLLRWFWWRINAYSEITAMLISFVMALCLELPVFDSLESYEKLIIGVSVTTAAWLLVTSMTRETDEDVLIKFVTLIRPYKIGWKEVYSRIDPIALGKSSVSLSQDLFLVFLGCVMIYAFLFGTGYLLRQEYLSAVIALFLGISASIALLQLHRNKST